jgi:hypothetical protein
MGYADAGGVEEKEESKKRLSKEIQLKSATPLRINNEPMPVTKKIKLPGGEL